MLSRISKRTLKPVATHASNLSIRGSTSLIMSRRFSFFKGVSLAVSSWTSHATSIAPPHFRAACCVAALQCDSLALSIIVPATAVRSGNHTSSHIGRSNPSARGSPAWLRS